jgi:hypothetical protein
LYAELRKTIRLGNQLGSRGGLIPSADPKKGDRV